MKVVSFYTNEKYKLLAEAMKASAEALGLQVHIKEYPDVAMWSHALRLKVVFIQEMLKTHDDDILYMDADTWFAQSPEQCLKGDFDVALGYVLPKHPLGCVMCFRNNPRVRALVDRWLEMFDLYPGTRLDETLLEYAMDEARRNGLAVRHLPQSYGWVKYFARRFPGANPVIHHLGAGEGSDKPQVLQEEESPYR